MRLSFLLLVLFTQTTFAQFGSWVEYPVNCELTEYSLRHITEEGHYVGLNITTGEYFYSIDQGQTWVEMCPEDDYRLPAKMETSNTGEFIFIGRRSINKFNWVTNTCERFNGYGSGIPPVDVLALASGRVVALTSDSLVYYASNGQIESGELLRSFTPGDPWPGSITDETIHFETGQQTYVSYHKSEEEVTCLREVDVVNMTRGAEIIIPEAFGKEFRYAGGVFYSTAGYSNDGGVSWITYQGVNSNEKILDFTAKDNEVFLFGEINSYYSSDGGDTFSSNIHGITFNTSPLVGVSLLNSTITIYDRNLSNNIIAMSTDLGVTWNIEEATLNSSNNWDIAAATAEQLITSSDCGKQSYDPSTSTWQDLSVNVYTDIKALPNDNLIYGDIDGYSLSRDLGATWTFNNWNFQFVEFPTSITCKENIVYITGFNQTLYSLDNGETFTLWEPPFWLLEVKEFDLFADRKVITYDRFTNSGSEFFLYDFETEEKTLLGKDFDSNIHIDMTTSWSGSSVFILEYKDDNQTEFTLQRSDDEGRTFVPRSLPFFLEGGEIKILSDHNDNIFIYNDKQIFIGQRLGMGWIELTPERTDLNSITDLTVSFDNYLYISTVGTGILRYDCDLSLDLEECIESLEDNDGDGFFSDVDCNDNDDTIFPGATESCNGIDDNCDSQIDEGFTVIRYYQDLDGDGYGNSMVSVLDCVQPTGYSSLQGDCDDNETMTNPGASEVCNGIDENCDGNIDEGLTFATYYLDEDGDGYGTINSPIVSCSIPAGYTDSSNDCNDSAADINPGATDIPGNGIDEDCNGSDATAIVDNDGDGFFSDVDCNDNDDTIFPGAVESCNNMDDNCDGNIDEGLTLTTYYLDNDGDGYGTTSSSITSCSILTGYTTNFNDCNDSAADINPGATDIPGNGIDEDCNGSDAIAIVDNDGDGFFSDVDCNDNDPNINPGAAETCNTEDDNCNGQVDEGLTVLRYYEDKDGDGYGNTSSSLLDCKQPSGYAIMSGDCDDNNASIFPGQTEAPYNGVDDDCDAATLDNDLDQDGFLNADDCDDNNANVNAGQTEIPYNGLDDDCNAMTLDDDLDQDGFLLADDCDDQDNSINPDAFDIPDNGIDEDCDGIFAVSFVDADGDGVTNETDCDDADPAVYPGADEICDQKDNNCDGIVDEGFDLISYYEDQDNDGYGDALTLFVSCETSLVGYVLNGQDCDDSNVNINPDGVEIVNNGIDEDCDGMDLTSSTHELSGITLSIYPNPATDIINIDMPATFNYKANLYNIEGQLVLSTMNQSKIYLHSVVSGTYLLEIIDLDSGQKVIEKIVKAM